MNLLNQIKQSVSVASLKNLASQLQESEMGIQQGLGLGVNVFLASIIAFVGKNEKGLLEVLNDGGHTGDILNNFESFTNNQEKSRLLDTIGGNIVSHFLSSKKDNTIGHISEISGVSRVSASYLLNLASPLVLGFLGKEVRDNNWQASDLKTFLEQEEESVLMALPEVMVTALGSSRNRLSNNTEVKHKAAIKELNKRKKKTSEVLGLILPWIFLFVLGGFIFYLTKNKETDSQNANELARVEEDSSDFMPITELAVDSAHVAKTDDKKTSLQEVAPVKPVVVDTPPLNLRNSTAKVAVNPTSVKTIEVKPSRESVQETVNIPSGFTDISDKSYGNESAEIVNAGNVRTLISNLKNTNKQIKISHFKTKGRLGEDRAYALKDYLIENGINADQISINSVSSGRNASGIVYRVID